MRRILLTGGSGFIGTNYVEHLLSGEEEVCVRNIDISKPQIESQEAHWEKCDILNFEILDLIITKFQPTEIIHLAARTDTDSSEINDYLVNSEGTANVLKAAERCQTLKRLIVTSTQFVKRPGTQPNHETDFDPHTAYGESKVISEKLTRAANLGCSWTIIRPTNIWGPWHPRYPYEFWRVLAKGLYFHPSGRSAKRSYGYVDNVIYQIEEIFKSKPDIVDEEVFYVGDKPIDLIDWVDGFSISLTGKKSRVIPRSLIRALALIGDILSHANIRFPITTSRFKSMTTDDLVPIEKTLKTFGESPISLEQGIIKTKLWLKNQNLP